MSVFAGGCDPEAFAAVYDNDTSLAANVLDELVRTSFVAVEFSGHHTRYRMLEPVRQHAQHLLSDDEVIDSRRRHLDHYLAVARRNSKSVDELASGTNLDALEVELGNFRAALDWAATDLEGVDAGLFLVARLNDLWNIGAHHQEGLSRTIGLLDVAGGSAPARSEAALCASFLASEMSDNAYADRLEEQALVEAQEGGDRCGEVRARNSPRLISRLLRRHRHGPPAPRHGDPHRRPRKQRPAPRQMPRRIDEPAVGYGEAGRSRTTDPRSTRGARRDAHAGRYRRTRRSRSSQFRTR